MEPRSKAVFGRTGKGVTAQAKGARTVQEQADAELQRNTPCGVKL